MNINEELRKIDAFFDNMSMDKFDEMLIKNGIENSNYQLDYNVEFYYKLNSYKDVISKLKTREKRYERKVNSGLLDVSYSSNDINLEAA